MDPSGFFVPATTELHISHADAAISPIAPSHGPNHDHPPYTEMITAAISALKERNGSSRQAIAKYIERAYKDQLPPSHSTLLTHHLKRLKNNGHLLMFKHSYMLPGSDYSSLPPPPPASTDAPTDTARKRGRPPKPNTTDQPNSEPVSAVALVDGPHPPPPPPPAAATTTTTTMVTRRKPGRPPRAVSGVMGLDGIKKKNPGRPRKTKLVSGVMGPERIKRGPGRPAKIQTMPVMIPYLSDDVPHRSRGRPKKDGSSRANAPMNAIATSNGGGTVWAKRRGRPSKVGGTKKPIKGIGKPAGRPRKNNALVRVQSGGPPLWMVDYGYVKSQLDNVQSRIKRVVGLLKPHIINENEVSLVAALQELEEMSTMDVIGAPSHAVQVQEPASQLLNVEGQEQVLQNQEPHLEHLRV